MSSTNVGAVSSNLIKYKGLSIFQPECFKFSGTLVNKMSPWIEPQNPVKIGTPCLCSTLVTIEWKWSIRKNVSSSHGSRIVCTIALGKIPSKSVLDSKRRAKNWKMAQWFIFYHFFFAKTNLGNVLAQKERWNLGPFDETEHSNHINKQIW